MLCERKEIRLGDWQLLFLLAFRRLKNQFEQDLLKLPAAYMGPESLNGNNRRTNCTTCPYYQSSEKGKNAEDLYTCFKHLPKCKAVVNQVTPMCMLMSILLCYWGVQEESWKASDVLFSIPSQHVIIAKPSLDYFFFSSSLFPIGLEECKWSF